MTTLGRLQSADDHVNEEIRRAVDGIATSLVKMRLQELYDAAVARADLAEAALVATEALLNDERRLRRKAEARLAEVL